MPIYNGQFVESLSDGRQRTTPTALAAVGPILGISVSIPKTLQYSTQGSKYPFLLL